MDSTQILEGKTGERVQTNSSPHTISRAGVSAGKDTCGTSEGNSLRNSSSSRLKCLYRRSERSVVCTPCTLSTESIRYDVYSCPALSSRDLRVLDILTLCSRTSFDSCRSSEVLRTKLSEEVVPRLSLVAEGLGKSNDALEVRMTGLVGLYRSWVTLLSLKRWATAKMRNSGLR